MRRIIAMLLLLAVALWFAPPQLEDVSGQCRALESMVLRAQVGPPAQGEAVARRVMQYARERHAGLPPGLGCAMVYWELVFDADLSLFQADPPPR